MMKTRKFKDAERLGDSWVKETIGSLLKVKANAGDPKVRERCDAAIQALGAVELRRVESLYLPETKKFKVSFDVKRSGVHTMVVEATDSADAKAKAERRIATMDEDEFQSLGTEFVGVDVVDSDEVVDGEEGEDD